MQQQQQRGSDDDRSSASAAGSFRSSFLQTGDSAESTRKDSHWPIAAQGSFRWENEPGPNQVSPLGRETRPILVSPVGQVAQAKPGQSSRKMNHGQTRSVQCEKKPGKTKSSIGKRNQGKSGQFSGKKRTQISPMRNGTRPNQVTPV
ncbi:unnamed protein product [Sphagnum troendelagicum]|uniref:Uncharacterized protein n=1 Tax=Sphagnum troendelagicum TaxID=128251 RepID=A0ABP0UME6_9BRYO